jgi:hypothetical protein
MPSNGNLGCGFMGRNGVMPTLNFRFIRSAQQTGWTHLAVSFTFASWMSSINPGIYFRSVERRLAPDRGIYAA